MAKDRELIVLRECRFLLQSLSLSEENSSARSISTLSKLLFCFLICAPMNMLCSTYIWFAYDENFILDKTVWVLNLSVAIIQNDLIFFCFVANKSRITDIMQKLQFLIDQRKWK